MSKLTKEQNRERMRDSISKSSDAQDRLFKALYESGCGKLATLIWNTIYAAKVEAENTTKFIYKIDEESE